MEEFYKINQIAGLFGISCDTLRLYEKNGLLEPAYTDERTKYRYYGIEEILRLDYIIQLKNIGFTLSEIKKVLDIGLNMPQKREILQNRYNNLRELLSIYDGLMNSGEFDIERKITPEHYAITKEVFVNNWEDLIEVYVELTHRIIINKCTLKHSSYPYAIMGSDFSYNNFFCTACMEIEDTTCEHATFFPEQSYLSLKYKGNYDSLPKAYERLYSYAEQNAITLLQYSIERYIVAYDNSPLSSNFITEINLPISNVKR
jgi:DNA-binding transcriptional MerR regulator